MAAAAMASTLTCMTGTSSPRTSLVTTAWSAAWTNISGRIIDHLDALGLAENTLVVFTSDHGHYFGQHGLIAKGAFHYDDGVRVPMIVRLPGRIAAGGVSHSLQSLVDYAPTFLDYCGLDAPADMTGIPQGDVWQGDETAAREHVIIENRHQPTTLHLKTYIDGRYKITLYFNRDYGEIFDLRADPGELDNLWSRVDTDPPADAELRAALTEAFLRAEMLKEEPLGDGSLALPHKSAAMYLKSCNLRGTQINFDPAADRYELFDLAADPGRLHNLWDSAAHRGLRAEMVRALLFSRWGLEPLWMPRIAGA